MIAQISHLGSVWFGGDDLRERINEKVDSYANGESDHATGAMVLLWELSRGGSFPTQGQYTPGSVTLTEVIAVYPLILASFCR